MGNKQTKQIRKGLNHATMFLIFCSLMVLICTSCRSTYREPIADPAIQHSVEIARISEAVSYYGNAIEILTTDLTNSAAGLGTTLTDLSILMEKYDNIRPIKLKRFPLLGEIACGQPIFADEDRESYVEVGTDIRADFCLRAKGDSMINAGILEGDKVIVRPQSSADNGQIVVARIEDEATVKRLSRKNGQVWLMPENEHYEPIDGRDARILGLVKAVVREY